MLTPGGLRGGFAVWSYRRGAAVQNIMWTMRLRSQVTPECKKQFHSTLSLVWPSKPGVPSMLRPKLFLFYLQQMFDPQTFGNRACFLRELAHFVWLALAKVDYATPTLGCFVGHQLFYLVNSLLFSGCCGGFVHPCQGRMERTAVCCDLEQLYQTTTCPRMFSADGWAARNALPSP